LLSSANSSVQLHVLHWFRAVALESYCKELLHILTIYAGPLVDMTVYSVKTEMDTLIVSNNSLMDVVKAIQRL